MRRYLYFVTFVAALAGLMFGFETAVIKGAIYYGLATNIWMFVIARFLGGIAVGGASVLTPMYISEVSPPKIRGQLVATNQLSIVTGILVAFFAISQGPVIRVVLSEIFPNSVRAKGTATGSFSHWIFNFGIALLFPVISSMIGVGYVFVFLRLQRC